MPSLLPSALPTSQPSNTNLIEISQGYATQLFVNELIELNDIEQEIFEGIMKLHTSVIGYEVGKPFIITESTILHQDLGDTCRRRRRKRERSGKRQNMFDRFRALFGIEQEDIENDRYGGQHRRIGHVHSRHLQNNSAIANNNTTDVTVEDTASPSPPTSPPQEQVEKVECYIVQVHYIIDWSTRYGYDITTYPTEFRSFMNTQNGTTLESLRDLIDDLSPGWDYVQRVGNTVFDNDLTFPPTRSPIAPAAPAPAVENTAAVTATVMKDTNSPTLSPTTVPSISTQPSIIPSVSKELTIEYIDKDSDLGESPVRGALIGVLVAFALVAFGTVIFVGVRWYRNKSTEDCTKDDIKDGEPTSISVTAERRLANQADLNGLESAAPPQHQFPSIKGDSGVGGQSTSRRSSSSGRNRRSGSSIPQDVEAGNNMSMSTTPGTQYTSSTARSSTAYSNSIDGMSGRDTFRETIGQTDQAQKKLIYPSINSIPPGTPNRTPQEESTLCYTPDESPSKNSTFVGANLIANRSNSFSSESFENDESSYISVGPDGDEFDKYRNQLLDTLRAEVEVSIDDVDSMLSLAITRVLTSPDTPLDLSWIGGEDLGSIEASCLCQAFDWERKRDPSMVRGSVLSNDFFAHLMKTIVFIVHHGLIRPHDGARILHGCASIIGLSLLEDVPNTTIAVQGLIKSNDLAQGHHLLVSAFESFGDIVDAAIAPCNRGFGFVRFVNSKSVEEVMQRHTVDPIEIQDVAVSIKNLVQ